MGNAVMTSGSGVIGADVEQLRATVAALRQGSSNIESALQQAMRGMEALQSSRWSGQHRQQAEAIWARIQGQFVPTIEALNELAARTERFANALESVGQRFNDGASVPSGPSVKAPSDGGPPAPPVDPVSPINGIPPHTPLPNGPTRADVLRGTAGCTNYVLRKVNMDDMGRWPDAYKWNEAAEKAGYALGSVPLKGSVMVFEPGVLGGHAQLGHVAYVENVETDEKSGLMRVKISEASVPYDNNGQVVWGAHTPPTERIINLRHSGDGVFIDDRGKRVDVSFIYGKKKM
ncbi:CHAP domain-containing protein [Roseiflexus sp.]|uniref:CHAP domain-containing protein n=1 Tax=Roseiflexus sp. TaxID=2562120 RepID=UPI00398B13CC